MADFTTSYIGGPPGSPVSPQQPVVDQSGLVGLNILGGLVEGLSSAAVNIGQQRQEVQKAEQAQAAAMAEGEVMTAFSREQLKLVDAVESGQMSSSEARMRMRANLQQFGANNPTLQIDLAKAHTSVIKSTGLGDVVYEGTEQEKNQRTLEASAQAEGWIKPDDGPSQRAAGADAYSRWLEAQRILKDEKQRLELQQARVSLSTAGINQRSAALNLQRQQAAVQSQRGIGMASQALTEKVAGDMEQIRRAQEAGIMTREQAAMAINQKYLEVSQFVSTNFADAGADYLNGQLTGVKMLHDNYSKYVSGAVKAEALKNDNDIAMGIAAQTALGVPSIARLAGFSKVLPNSSAILSNQIGAEAAKYLTVNSNVETKPSDPFPDYEEDKVGRDQYFGMMRDAIGKVNTGNTQGDPKEVADDVMNNFTNIMRGIEVYSPTAQTKDYAPVVDFISDPNVGKFVTAQGGWADVNAANRAANTVKFVYDNELVPMIKKEWENFKVAGGVGTGKFDPMGVEINRPEQKASELIQPVFRGSGVAFDVKPGVTDAVTRRYAKKLNEDVAGLLNKMIRSQAHLEGHTDYKSVYEASYKDQVFGMGEEKTE